MMNKYFPDEEITYNDVFFMCYMVERLGRRLHRRNKYVVNKIGYDELVRLLSVANVLHCKNPLDVEDEWIEDFNLKEGKFNIYDVDTELCKIIPTDLDMGKVYSRLVVDTLLPDEDYAQAMIRVYNNKICKKIDCYSNGAFYEPSYVIVRAYNNGGF